jgi:uncharacterized protein Yka (UPF0111/DUF47 family)
MGIAKAFKRGQKEDKFVQLLIDQSEATVEGLRLLEKWIKKDPLAEKAIVQLSKKESEADEIRRILIDELHNTFITPLDREDIFKLSLHIDDMLDYAYTTVEEMQMLEIDADEHLVEMVRHIRGAAEEIALAVQRLSANPRVAADHARRARKRENEVEHRYRVAISELFNQAKDFDQLMGLLRRREIYRHVSNMADRVNMAADVLGMIVMKIT